MVLVSGSRFSSNGNPAIWLHHLHSDTGRAAPPVRADMIFGKDSPDDLCEVVDGRSWQRLGSSHARICFSSAAGFFVNLQFQAASHSTFAIAGVASLSLAHGGRGERRRAAGPRSDPAKRRKIGLSLDTRG